MGELIVLPLTPRRAEPPAWLAPDWADPAAATPVPGPGPGIAPRRRPPAGRHPTAWSAQRRLLTLAALALASAVLVYGLAAALAALAGLAVALGSV